MPVKDKLDLSNPNRLDILVDWRRFLVGVVVVVTMVFAALIPGMETDPSLKSGVDSTSPAYVQYDKFLKVFGSEEFILVAIKSEQGVDDPRILNTVEALGQRFEAHDVVAEVVSLPNMRVFQKKGTRFGNYPVLRNVNGNLSLPERPDLERIRQALPVTDFLLSEDLKTVALLLRMEDRAKHDPKAIQALLADIRQALAVSNLAGAEYRIIGAPLIRQAIVKYSIETGIIFGILCLLIGTVVSVYIFKSLKVTAITNIILGSCIVWILGLMSLMKIPLNSTTALSFGFIPITTLEIVIHVVVRYHQFHQTTLDKVGAVKQAVRWLARPCFICSATTAVGFGTLMVSSIPMVRQLGFIMSLGIMVSYCLAFILAPAFFLALKSLNAAEAKGVLRDWLNYLLRKCETYIFGYYRLLVIAGVAATIVLFMGAPLIRSDIQVLRMLNESTSVVKDIKFVENNLTAVTSLELMLEAGDNAFKKPEAWIKVRELENRLRQIPEVESTDSFLPLLEYLNNILGEGHNPGMDLLSKPEAIPQLLLMTSFSAGGERVRRRFLDENFDRLRMSVRIKNSPTVPIGETIETIRKTADSVMEGVAKATVTGDLAVFAGQTSRLIHEQILSMCLAAIIITVLMMIQLGSPMLGIVCLLPNIPPVAAVFGIMGWFGVSLDGVTIFAATVVVGLAVDNTIHYLTQLKREIRLNPDQGVEQCVRTAYRLTARQIASWSFVIMLGFLALLVSPFRPVVLFGMLGCAAICLGFYGDLFFVQSLILNSATIRKAIARLIEREVASEA